MIAKKGLGLFLCPVFTALYLAMRRMREHGRAFLGASNRRFAVGLA
jgi:hypothetical protein